MSKSIAPRPCHIKNVTRKGIPCHKKICIIYRSIGYFKILISYHISFAWKWHPFPLFLPKHYTLLSCTSLQVRSTYKSTPSPKASHWKLILFPIHKIKWPTTNNNFSKAISPLILPTHPPKKSNEQLLWAFYINPLDTLHEKCKWKNQFVCIERKGLE